MDDNSPIEENLKEFNRRLAAWNAELTADIDLYDFMGLALNMLEGFEWVKSSVAAGVPLKTSCSPDEVIFEFADNFFERWRKVHFSVLLTGRNSKEEVLDALMPFIQKLCKVSGDCKRIMQMFDALRNKRIERVAQMKAEIEALASERARYNGLVSEVVSLRSEAKRLEEMGDLTGASIKLEEAVSFGKSSSLNPSDYLAARERLFIVYRKLKRYADEERVLVEAITSEASRGHEVCIRRARKYEERLAKCRALIAKSQKYE